MFVIGINSTFFLTGVISLKVYHQNTFRFIIFQFQEPEGTVYQHFDSTSADEPFQQSEDETLTVSRPNIGISTRDRPVFIVLAQESSDISYEENIENLI